MNHIIKIQPSSEPVTLAEMRKHLGITQASDTSRDTIISAHIKTARQWCEHFTRKTFIKQTLLGYAVDFPFNCKNDQSINLTAPLISVNTVKYLDSSGVQQTLSSDKYLVDLIQSCIVPAYGETWPEVRSERNAVEIDYNSGFGFVSPTPTETVLSGAYTTAASTTATDKFLLTVDHIVLINNAVGAGGVLAATVQAAITAFSAANVYSYTVTGTVAEGNLKIAKLDGQEINIAATFTDATGLLSAVGTTSGGTFATSGFIGITPAAGAASVPEGIKEAIKFIVGQWETFQTSMEGVVRQFTIPNAAKQLLDSYVDMREYF